MTANPGKTTIQTDEAAERPTQRHCFDFDRLDSFVGAMGADPAAGSVLLRSRHSWDGGFAVDGHTEGLTFSDRSIRTPHGVRTDWPAELGGGSSAPTAGQVGLAAVGSCVATSYAVEAAQRGVELDALEVVVEGWVDLRGAFELADVDVAPSQVRVTIHATAAAEDEVLAELAEAAERSSPMYQSFANPVRMRVELGR